MVHVVVSKNVLPKALLINKISSNCYENIEYRLRFQRLLTLLTKSDI